MIHAGKLRHFITIQRPINADTDSAGFETIWETVASVRAAVEPLAGREYLAARQNQSEVTTKFTVRYLVGMTDGLDSSMRISFNGAAYDIREVLDIEERHREIQVMAVKRTEEQ